MLIHRTNELTTFFSMINQEELRVKIDTGSKYNVISQAALNHVNPNALINTSFPIKLIAFGA